MRNTHTDTHTQTHTHLRHFILPIFKIPIFIYNIP